MNMIKIFENSSCSAKGKSVWCNTKELLYQQYDLRKEHTGQSIVFLPFRDKDKVQPFVAPHQKNLQPSCP